MPLFMPIDTVDTGEILLRQEKLATHQGKYAILWGKVIESFSGLDRKTLSN